MRLRNLIVVCVICGGGAIAQESLIGKYSGTFESRSTSPQAVGGLVRLGMELNIEKVENEKVTGVMTNLSRSACNGNYTVEGTIKEQALVLRAAKGGTFGDCGGYIFRLNVDGNKLIGTIGSGGNKVELSK